MALEIIPEVSYPKEAHRIWGFPELIIISNFSKWKVFSRVESEESLDKLSGRVVFRNSVSCVWLEIFGKPPEFPLNFYQIKCCIKMLITPQYSSIFIICLKFIFFLPIMWYMIKYSSKKIFQWFILEQEGKLTSEEYLSSANFNCIIFRYQKSWTFYIL